ncbi:hypothetical protein IJM86_03310 [bacterium]|nr:hypothetical protein [bacterium]
MPETYQEHSYEQIQEALNNEKSAKEYYEKGINVINQYIKEVKSKENLFWKDATKPFLDLKAKLESTQQRLIDYKWFDDKANIELVAKNINEADKDVLKNLNSFKSLQEI